MKQIALPVLTLLLAALLIAPVQAQDANLPVPQLEYVDAQVDVFLANLAEIQSQFYGTRGQYFQALQSHSTVPENIAAPDRLSAAPTDQAEDLAYLWQTAALPEVLDWTFAVHTYNGPDGAGYVVYITTSVEGVAYVRAVNVGPDDSRTFAWQAADVEE